MVEPPHASRHDRPPDDVGGPDAAVQETRSAAAEVRRALVALHARVDAEAARLARAHAGRLVCARGCSACCVDELTVFEVEAERIRESHPHVLAETPHGPGACAFLDAEGACRIYDARPYVCRTQGLPLLHFHEAPDESIHEERSICELNAEGTPLEELDFDACWLLGPVELELQRLQQRATGDQRRVALRSLFPGPDPRADPTGSSASAR